LLNSHFQSANLAVKDPFISIDHLFVMSSQNTVAPILPANSTFKNDTSSKDYAL